MSSLLNIKVFSVYDFCVEAKLTDKENSLFLINVLSNSLEMDEPVAYLVEGTDEELFASHWVKINKLLQEKYHCKVGEKVIFYK